MTVDLAALAKLAAEADSLRASYGRGNRRDDADYLDARTLFEKAASPDVVAALVRVALAAQTYAAFTHGNIRGQRYHARQEARDALADALEELE